MLVKCPFDAAEMDTMQHYNVISVLFYGSFKEPTERFMVAVYDETTAPQCHLYSMSCLLTPIKENATLRCIAKMFFSGQIKNMEALYCCKLPLQCDNIRISTPKF